MHVKNTVLKKSGVFFFYHGGTDQRFLTDCFVGCEMQKVENRLLRKGEVIGTYKVEGKRKRKVCDVPIGRERIVVLQEIIKRRQDQTQGIARH